MKGGQGGLEQDIYKHQEITIVPQSSSVTSIWQEMAQSVTVSTALCLSFSSPEALNPTDTTVQLHPSGLHASPFRSYLPMSKHTCTLHILQMDTHTHTHSWDWVSKVITGQKLQSSHTTEKEKRWWWKYTRMVIMQSLKEKFAILRRTLLLPLWYNYHAYA